MATTAGHAPSKTHRALQIVRRARARWAGAVERRLEAERDQLPLWVPVALGAGITIWFVLPDPRSWIAALLAALGIAGVALAGARGGRSSVVVAAAAIAVAAGVSLVWWRSQRVAAPVLPRPAIVGMIARVERVEPRPAQEATRLVLLPQQVEGASGATFPRRVRVNVGAADMPAAGIGVGAKVLLRARLMPPAPPPVPGAYDFARTAWFAGLGATGRSLGRVRVVAPGAPEPAVRQRLSAHIEERLPGSAGGIASALATGDTGAIAEPDAEAMRRAGLAHLLSVSGLHLTAVVGLVVWMLSRLLALSPRLALTGRVPLLAATGAAAAAIGYTWLTGSEVPTVRSCVAALMVLAALAIGREAITLRLVAAGALIVLVAWPEALAGPSFQLSFAAVTAIVALHEHPRIRAALLARDEPVLARLARGAASLLLTGVAVELALMPIAAFHFHKAGLYGAAANILAIPLTTFVIMPVEALALLLDVPGWGAPLWWVASVALDLLLALAHRVAAAPGAVTAIPVMPPAAFALMIAGGLWLALWRSGWRRWGVAPLLAGAIWTAAAPRPDLIVTGDGRHLAVRTPHGWAMLRDRSGDYTHDLLAESAGVDDTLRLLSADTSARCNRDICRIDLTDGSRRWRIVATRSTYLVPVRELIRSCRDADIMVSERRLPRGCTARWLTLDRTTLAATGGIAVDLATRTARPVLVPGDAHPWRAVSRSGAGAPRAYPERAPARGHNAADRRSGSQDRAGSSLLRDGNI